MATGGGLALPEHLQDEDARSWFKRFEVWCMLFRGTEPARNIPQDAKTRIVSTTLIDIVADLFQL